MNNKILISTESPFNGKKNEQYQVTGPIKVYLKKTLIENEKERIRNHPDNGFLGKALSYTPDDTLTPLLSDDPLLSEFVTQHEHQFPFEWLYRLSDRQKLLIEIARENYVNNTFHEGRYMTFFEDHYKNENIDTGKLGLCPGDIMISLILENHQHTAENIENTEDISDMEYKLQARIFKRSYEAPYTISKIQISGKTLLELLPNEIITSNEIITRMKPFSLNGHSAK